MNASKIKYVLVAIWLVALVFCLAILLPAKQALPDLFGKAMDQVIETFSPQLAVMFTFIFSDQFVSEKRNKVNKFVGALAIILSSIYVLTFCYFMFEFYRERYDAAEVINSFETIRPKTAFLITAVVAYFFAARKKGTAD